MRLRCVCVDVTSFAFALAQGNPGGLTGRATYISGFPGEDNIFGEVGGDGPVRGIDTFNRKLQNSILPSNQMHVLVTSWSYDILVGRDKHFLSGVDRAVNPLVGGSWLTATLTYRSGTEIAVGGGPAPRLSGGENQPNWIGADVRSPVSMPSFDPAKDRYLDRCFQPVSAVPGGKCAAAGASRKNAAFLNENFSVFKNAHLTEALAVQIRGERYNAQNRFVFSGSPGSINNPAKFGIIASQANTQDVIQPVAKFIF